MMIKIRRREHAFARRALAAWRTDPHIEILGSTELERLGIISFGVRHAGRQLHANFVVALLSDLFGIQARSGCFCAGPYLHRLHGIDDELSARMQAEALNGHLGAMLGFTRISFNYFISETTFAYIVDAVHLLAEHGWKLLPLYSFDPGSGQWRHRDAGPGAHPGLSEMLAAMPGRLARAPEVSEGESPEWLPVHPHLPRSSLFGTPGSGGFATGLHPAHGCATSSRSRPRPQRCLSAWSSAGRWRPPARPWPRPSLPGRHPG